MSPSQQLDALAKNVQRGVAAWGSKLLLVIAVGLAMAGMLYRQPTFLVTSFLALASAYTAHRFRSNARNAVHAFKHGIKTQANVIISIMDGSDATLYHATVNVSAEQNWHFQFVPLGWRPQEGIHEATLHTMPDMQWPALIQIADGILYPYDTPKLKTDV